VVAGIRIFAAGAALTALLAGPLAAHADARVKAVTDRLALESSSVLVLDATSGQVIFDKNPSTVVPIASLTKLMTAMVVLDSGADLQERITITDDDVDWLKGSSSRLRVGTVLTRDEMLGLTLMASENRAASALARSHPGGRAEFIRLMNEKARSLNLGGTHYAESTGLSSANVSTAEDLAVIVRAASTYPKIREYSTLRGMDVMVAGRPTQFRNTNGLVASPQWEIGLSKTGFIREAGRCLVMQATLAGRAVIIVLLDSWGRHSRLADANRIRNWIEAAAGIKRPVERVRVVSTPKKAKAQVASRARGRAS
jgi:serine-type D-Ala-D-Ala endopeptidase (penicillin-binding protein 7)